MNSGIRRRWRDYRTAAGGRPVREFLDTLDDEEVAAVVAGMREVAQNGLRSARHLRGDLYEVRSDASTRSFRLVFAVEGRRGRILLALCGFEKRSTKAPARHLEIAGARLAEWRRRGVELRSKR